MSVCYVAVKWVDLNEVLLCLREIAQSTDFGYTISSNGKPLNFSRLLSLKYVPGFELDLFIPKYLLICYCLRQSKASIY